MSIYDLRSYFTPTLVNGGYVPEPLPTSAYQAARGAGLTTDQIQSLASQQSLSFSSGAYSALSADVNAGFNSQLNSQIEQLSSGFDDKIDGLNSQLSAQNASYASAQQQFNSQISAQQSQFQEQSNKFANLQSAQVPTAEKVAGEQPSDAAKQKQRASPLSSLAIVSGLGTQANPLSGLQLA